VAQEEATKVSKRAQRRAAEDSERPEAEGTADADVEAGLGTARQPSAPPAAPAPNRQARRQAAAKARADRKRERTEAAAIGLDAGEMVDDALVRVTDKVSRFGRKHWNVIQWVIGLGLLGGLGFQIYTWHARSVNAKSTDLLFEAAQAEQGTIGDPREQGKPDANGVISPYPIFETEAARQAAALEAYRKAAAERPGSPTEGFARIGEGGVLLDMGKVDEALDVFQKLAASSLAQKYPDLRARALEGKGHALEARGDLPGARSAFEELATVPGFENQALYQQARIAAAQNDLPAAKAALNKLFKALGAPKAASFGGLPERPDFLRERATALAAVIDPLEKEVQVPKPPLGNDAVQQMLKQLEEQGVVTRPAAPAE
jgi:tetratricopeptide (TPR) repeat protein